ncbi:MAG: DUF192 domain-containing protein [Phycisphaerales bacterium]|nr:DUF192 domain-containing protein [Phycisphaerales bacterium]
MKTNMLCALMMMASMFSGCSPTEPNELDKLGVTTVKAKTLTVQAWIADESEERFKGLMFVTAGEMASLPDGHDRGMIFIFQGDQTGGFWMRNTIIDLDIAFIREDGTVVDTFTMKALDESSYTPRSAYRYALEVNAGVLGKHGIRAGDQVDLSAVRAKSPEHPKPR